MMSVEEYLHTEFEGGDRDYVDGVTVERNVGEVDHSHIQTGIAYYLLQHYKRFWVGVEVRVQVAARRFRVPDVTVVDGGKPKGKVITHPPCLVIEVLSPDDRAVALQDRIDDYFAFGIPNIWVIDPAKRRGMIHTPEGSREARDGILRTEDPRIEVPLAALFE